jgi:hypothetical protein
MVEKWWRYTVALGLGAAQARHGSGSVRRGSARRGVARLGLAWLGTKSLSGSHPFLNRFASGKSHWATLKEYILDAHEGWNRNCTNAGKTSRLMNGFHIFATNYIH